MSGPSAAEWPPGVGLVWLDEVDSTNEEARRRAAAGETGPLWIAANRQFAGRGRQGRAWNEAGGNLYSTLLLRPESDSAAASLLSFAACLSVAEFFESKGGKAALKWPNDALLNGGKAAGVLLEAAGQARRLDWLAIGIGVNLVSHPPYDGIGTHPPTDLFTATGKRVEAKDALSFIATRLAHWSSVLIDQGFGPVREAWLSRAAKLGERIEARMPRETLKGVFEDVDAEGALALRTPSGLRKIHAADIYFR